MGVVAICALSVSVCSRGELGSRAAKTIESPSSDCKRSRLTKLPIIKKNAEKRM
jgi:hypothetical protein